MKKFSIVCRSSPLSLIQAEIAKRHILLAFPNLEVDIIPKDTSGDLNKTQPLYELEGRNFFSKEIDEYILGAKADFAVHSLKDLSAERLFDTIFTGAILERNDPRDVVIFNENIKSKIANYETLVIGTSSLRRQEQAIKFLDRALPFTEGRPTQLITKTIRGNVDSRLSLLHAGEYDGIILAAAGLNRLLGASNEKVAHFLDNKKVIFLPLIECAPAPGQGALLIEALSTNQAAVDVIQKINNRSLASQLNAERQAVAHLGDGCHQKYGAINISSQQQNFINISGVDSNGNNVSNMLFDISLQTTNKQLLSATDHMKGFFSYEYLSVEVEKIRDIVFVAHHRAVIPELIPVLKQKRVWASGSRTWFELAKLGIWCEGCADGLGFDFLGDVFARPLSTIAKHNISILTNYQSSKAWMASGVHSIGTYKLIPSIQQDLAVALSEADIVYWTNFMQYEAAKPYLKPTVQHLCPSGKTAEQFINEGINPVVFPGIKSFNLWRHQNNL